MARPKKKYNERIFVGVDASGRRIRKRISADSRPELEALKREALRKGVQLSGKDISIGEYAETWFETYKSTKALKTQEMYKTSINKLKPIWNKSIKAVTETDLQIIINKNVDHPRICEQFKLTVHQIYNQAIKDKLVDAYNLADDLDIPKREHHEMRFITDAEMTIIIACEFKPIDKLFVDLLRNTGMRPAEALALLWSDINFADCSIRVSRAFEFSHNQPSDKPTKTKVIRTIPISREFADYLQGIEKGSEYLIYREDGKPFSLSAYKKMYKRVFTIINAALGGNDEQDMLSGMTFYSFRHTYATFLYYQGCQKGIISTKKAAQIMGHSEEVFLKRYTHIDEDKEKLSDLVSQIASPSKK